MIHEQQKYIDRVNSCHTGHIRRVRRAAWKRLAKWAKSIGFNPQQQQAICKDADDMAKLELNADE